MRDTDDAIPWFGAKAGRSDDDDDDDDVVEHRGDEDELCNPELCC